MISNYHTYHNNQKMNEMGKGAGNTALVENKVCDFHERRIGYLLILVLCISHTSFPTKLSRCKLFYSQISSDNRRWLETGSMAFFGIFVILFFVMPLQATARSRPTQTDWPKHYVRCKNFSLSAFSLLVKSSLGSLALWRKCR